ncbi:HAD family phosphatase [Methylobacillus gramineus]|uniref:HAD family hydrolase n=1 Tax=Methylobacillus gramineus TaxID=755169 RepID=UPI001CFFBEB5|nr:HAD family phosphatase [Methylobacillus gramineus]MCB5184390.1 HAD family phosphatase [Methylobacillus gramineus]
MSRYKLVIFDCDGVLVDSETITNRIFADMLNEAGIPASMQDMQTYFVGNSLPQCGQIVFDLYGKVLDAGFIEQYKPRRDQALKSQLQAVAGVKELLAALRLPCCVASNSDGDKVREMLTLCDLIQYFDQRIFSAADLGKPKPAPDVYLYAAATMGFEPADCLVIEDTHIGVSAAVAAGITVIGYSGTMPAERLMNAGASQVISHMSEVSGLLS